MRLGNAFACPRRYKAWIALELQHGSAITRNIQVG
jgi:hypothetical protein